MSVSRSVCGGAHGIVLVVHEAVPGELEVDERHFALFPAVLDDLTGDLINQLAELIEVNIVRLVDILVRNPHAEKGL